MFEQWVGWEFNDSEEIRRVNYLFFYLLEQHKHLQETAKNQAKHLFKKNKYI